MTNDMNTITIKISSSVKPEIRKYQAYANTLKDYLLKDDFLRILQGWEFTPEMIEDLESVMLRYPRYSLNEKQKEWLEAYRSSIVTSDRKKELADFLSINGISNIDEIITMIDNIKTPKEIKGLSNNTSLKKSAITLKGLCEVVIKYLGKDGECGWNYENVKR